MPNIRTYENKDGGFTANNMAATADSFAGNALRQDLSGAGQAIGQGINKAGQEYVAHEVQAETSDLTAKYAQTFEQLTQSWNDAAKNADPNDPDTGKRWREEVMQPALQQLSDGLHTDQAKEHAQRLGVQLEAHMFEKTVADQSTIAGNAAVSNVNTMVNSLSNAVASDPTAMRGAMPMLEQSIDMVVSSHPNLSPAQASALKTRMLDEGKANIAKSAAIGMIDKNPDLFRQAAAGGQFDKYLDATTIKQLDTYADTQQRAALTAQRAAETEQRRQQTEYVNNTANQIFANQVDPNTGAIHIQPDYFKQVARLALLPNAPPGLGRAMADFGATKIKEEASGIPAVTDPHLYQTFSDRMFLPAGDPHALTLPEVYTARAQGMLSDKDFTFFKEAIGDATKDPAKVAEQKQLSTLIGTYKATITKSNMFGADALGDQMYYRFQTDMRDAFQKGLAAGKTADELLSPTSKDYIVKNLTKYAVPTEDAINAQTAGGPTMVTQPLTDAQIEANKENVGPAVKAFQGQIQSPQPAATAAPEKKVVPRQPGETAAEYAKRIGG